MTARTFRSVPVIDVTPVFDPDVTEEQLDALATEVGVACRDVGFFYIAGHRLDEALIAQMFAQCRVFFDLPLEDKLQIRMGLTSQFRGYIPMLARRQTVVGICMSASTSSPSPVVTRKRSAEPRLPGGRATHSTTRASGRRPCRPSRP